MGRITSGKHSQFLTQGQPQSARLIFSLFTRSTIVFTQNYKQKASEIATRGARGPFLGLFFKILSLININDSIFLGGAVLVRIVVICVHGANQTRYDSLSCQINDHVDFSRMEDKNYFTTYKQIASSRCSLLRSRYGFGISFYHQPKSF